MVPAMASEAPNGRWIELPPTLYEDLKQMARAHMSRQRSAHTLSATALVHEALLKLANQAELKQAGKPKLLAVAACAMRSVLVDHARRRRARKRHAGGRRIPLDNAVAQYEKQSVDLTALDDALTRLATLDPRLAQLVELRFFGGLTEEQIAEAMEVSQRTVRRQWRLAKAWLRNAMGGGHDDG
jgi:RNA polymerase sigma-70 factor (ECF subfamily)